MRRTISILIPTHNRCDILARTLESLSLIQLPDQVAAEVIVVANACTDDTEAVVAAAGPTMPMPLRCVVEAEPGLNVARNRAAAEAKGDILAYLDDDVWVEVDWLVGLCEVYDKHPADVVGGRVLLWWEAVQPPVWMSKTFEIMFSGSDHGEEVFELSRTGKLGMLGANFSFKRKIWVELGGFIPGLDRTGKSLLSGGETEFLRRARAAGYCFFYSPRACVKHWVAPQRVRYKYLHRLAFDFGRTDIFMQPAKPKWQWWSVILGQPCHALISLVGIVPAKASGNHVSAMSRRLGAIKALGCAAGALQRFCGRSPLKEQL